MTESESIRDVVDPALLDAALTPGAAVPVGGGGVPLIRVRVSRDLDEAVRRAASAAGTSRSEWVRHALEQATRKGG